MLSIDAFAFYEYPLKLLVFIYIHLYHPSLEIFKKEWAEFKRKICVSSGQMYVPLATIQVLREDSVIEASWPRYDRNIYNF